MNKLYTQGILNTSGKIKAIIYLMLGLFTTCYAQQHDIQELSRQDLFEQHNFEFISHFEQGYAIAVLYDESILINELGHKIMNYPYDDWKPRFVGDNLIVKIGRKNKLINITGKEVIDSVYTDLKCVCDCNYFGVSKDGKSGILTYDNMKFHPLDNLPSFYQVTSTGYLLIKNVEKNNHYLMALDGTIINEIPYKFVRHLKNGNFTVRNEGATMLLDSHCENPISATYDKFDKIEEDYLITVKDNKQGIIDNNGVELLKPQYLRISETRGHFKYINEKSFGLLDSNMETVYEYDRGKCKRTFFHPPYYICVNDSSSFAYNTVTSTLQELPYKISYISSPFERLVYKSGNKSGLLNEDLTIKTTTGGNRSALGLTVIDVGKMKAILLPDGSHLKNQVYRTVKGLELNNKLILGDAETGRVGLFSRDGKEILPMEYFQIKHLHRNYLTIKKDGLQGVVKQNGDIILEPQYHKVQLSYGEIIIYKINGESFVLNE